MGCDIIFIAPQKQPNIFEEVLIQSGVDFSRDSIFNVKAQIAGNRPLK